MLIIFLVAVNILVVNLIDTSSCDDSMHLILCSRFTAFKLIKMKLRDNLAVILLSHVLRECRLKTVIHKLNCSFVQQTVCFSTTYLKYHEK